jgi:hypothetical protein
LLKSKTLEHILTYLAGLHVIEVNGLFYADWLCRLAASPIGPKLRDGEIGKSSNFPCTTGELLVGFLDSAQPEPTVHCPAMRQTTSFNGEQFHNPSADPGQIPSNCFFISLASATMADSGHGMDCISSHVDTN